MAKKQTKAQLAKEKREVKAWFKNRNPFPNGSIDRRMARAIKKMK
jgi:hypothetical protein